MIKGIKIQTFVTVKTVVFLIDEFISTTLEFFAPQQQLFLSSAISSASDEVYSPMGFTITHTLANNVPFGGIIKISIPPQIEVSDAADVIASCRASENLMATLSCELVIEEDGWL
jgi:predicted DNA-binding helix-hairpin-helix protein